MLYGFWIRHKAKEGETWERLMERGARRGGEKLMERGGGGEEGGGEIRGSNGMATKGNTGK